MLIREAAWLGLQIAQADAKRVFPLLDAGSSTEKFRNQQQPWIDRYIFAPARGQNLAVHHLDKEPAPGVDIVGDLTDPVTIEKLAGLGYRSVLCSNLLEHVQDRQHTALAVLSLIPPGGYVFLSCPYAFPYHPDPIDTRFRP